MCWMILTFETIFKLNIYIRKSCISHTILIKTKWINICKLSIKYILHFLSGNFSIQCQKNWTWSSRSETNIGYSSLASDLRFTGALSTIKNKSFKIKPITTMRNFMHYWSNVTNTEIGNPDGLPTIGVFSYRTCNIDFLSSAILNVLLSVIYVYFLHYFIIV